MNNIKLQNKYKIALVGYRLGGGGADKQMANLSIFLHNFGIEVHIVTVINEVGFQYAGEVFNTSNHKSKYFSRISRFWILYKFFNEHSFDFIIDFRFKNKWIQEFLINKLIYKNKNVIYRIASYDIKHYLPKNITTAKIIFNQAYKIITLTSKMEDLVYRNYKFKNLQTIPNAFFSDNINFSKEVFNETYILAVGNMNDEYKQFDHLILAFKKSNLKCKLYILGEGILIPKYQQLVDELQLSKQVEFLGYKENVLDFMRHAKFYVMSSKNEGFPNVLIESLAVGTPVISYDCDSGPSDIIQHEINGLLVDNQSIDSLSRAISRLYLDETLFNNCRANAKVSMQKFELNRIGLEWIKMLDLK